MSKKNNHNDYSWRGRLGGLATAMAHDSRVLTAPGRAAFLKRFLDAVDPYHQLEPAERERRAKAARREYFSRLGRRSAQVRRARAERRRAKAAAGEVTAR
jgi:hypothetical protein